MIEDRIKIGLVGRGFVVTWADANGVTHSAFCANRTMLGRVVMLEAAPMIRGDLPRIDEHIDIHAPRRRESDE